MDRSKVDEALSLIELAMSYTHSHSWDVPKFVGNGGLSKREITRCKTPKNSGSADDVSFVQQ